MPTLSLFGGEQDGHTVLITTNDRPDIFYAVPLAAYEEIRATHGKDARLAIRDKLAVLAYEYYESKTNGKTTEYRYRRTPEKDKPPVTAATSGGNE